MERLFFFFLPPDLKGVVIIIDSCEAILDCQKETKVPETGLRLEAYVLTAQRACSIYVLHPVSHFVPLKFASKKRG